jgi:chemotaxis-related protein WspD
VAKKSKPTSGHNDCWNTIGVWSTGVNKCDRLEQVVHCRNCDVFTKAGRKVLEKQAPSGYVVQWQNEIKHQINLDDKEPVSGMMFRLAREWYTIVSGSIVEIAERRTIHRVPHNNNKYIAGIVNIGGEVNICFSLSDLLDSGEICDEDSIYQRLIVIKSQNDRFIFPVSEVFGIVKYNEDTILPPPSTLDNRRKSYVKGIYRHNDLHVAVLDVDNVCRGLEGVPV